jgi:hypothetical protein
MSIEVFEGDVRLAVHKAGRHILSPLYWLDRTFYRLFLTPKVGKARMLCTQPHCLAVIFVHRKALHDLISHRFRGDYDIYKAR